MSGNEKALQECGSGQTTLIRHACEYASLGLRVIPLSGKTPFLERWPERATCDAERIKRWFTSWPDKNLGIATGGGIIAVDVDPRNGGRKSFRELTRGRRFPATATALTGSQGSHYLFRVDPSIRIKSRELRPGIDIKGEAGQIAVEPSVHPTTGKDYVWLRTPNQGIADAPLWLVRMLTDHQECQVATLSVQKPLDLTRHGQADDLLAKAIQRFPVLRQGQRNNVMLQVIGSLLGRNYRTELVMAVVTGWWVHFYRHGVVGTPPTLAPRLVGDAIKSILASPRFKRAIGTDHRAMIAKIELTDNQKALINRMVASGGQVASPPPSIRVTHKRKSRLLRHELEFVEALIIYFTYKVVYLREHPVQATNDQFRWPLEDRYNLKLANQQIERLVARYITRPDRPASRFELAVQTLKGHHTVASQYELTGIKELLPPKGL